MKTIEFMNGGVFELEYVLRLLSASEQVVGIEKMCAKAFITAVKPLIEERKKGYEISLDSVFDKLGDLEG